MAFAKLKDQQQFHMRMHTNFAKCIFTSAFRNSFTLAIEKIRNFSVCQDYTTKAMTAFIRIQMLLGYNTVQATTTTDLLTTPYAIMPALIHLSNNIQHW